MKKAYSILFVLTALAVNAQTPALSGQAQGHYKSFIVSTYATQGTVQALMNGNLDPAAVLVQPHAQSQD